MSIDSSMNARGDDAAPAGLERPDGARMVVARDLDALSARAAELFVTLAQRAAVEEGERFTVALSGGGTPQRLYRLLATPPYASQIPWDRVYVFWGDERHVPPDHEDSDYRMADEALLSQVPIPRENIYRIAAELPDAAEAARRYEDVLRGVLNVPAGSIPRLDLVLLGMGGDGHTASLFPGTQALHDDRHLVAAPWVQKLNTYRITLTPKVINNAAVVAFLVAGADKAATLHDVLEGPPEPDRLPAQLIGPTSGELVWFVDEAATAQLRR